ncbi:hypothetical protein [Streptomyces fructofermentans]|uniref:hypothetical protein n=1 Tax=Streptomyces fructofermentans TaxID=152141 RepID=UPI0037A106F9
MDGFADFMMRSRASALRAGTRPRSDGTVEVALASIHDLARFLASERGEQNWALTDVHDVEAFLAGSPKARNRRLVVLGQFFRFARSRKNVLVDPTRGLTSRGPNGFTGATLTLNQQRVPFPLLDHRSGHPPGCCAVSAWWAVVMRSPSGEAVADACHDVGVLLVRAATALWRGLSFLCCLRGPSWPRPRTVRGRP